MQIQTNIAFFDIDKSNEIHTSDSLQISLQPHLHSNINTNNTKLKTKTNKFSSNRNKNTNHRANQAIQHITDQLKSNKSLTITDHLYLSLSLSHTHKHDILL